MTKFNKKIYYLIKIRTRGRFTEHEKITYRDVLKQKLKQKGTLFQFKKIILSILNLTL